MSLTREHFLKKSLASTVFHLRVSSGEPNLKRSLTRESGDSVSEMWEGICRPLSCLMSLCTFSFLRFPFFSLGEKVKARVVERRVEGEILISQRLQGENALGSLEKSLAVSGGIFMATDTAGSEATSFVPPRGHLELQLTVSEHPGASLPCTPAPLCSRTFSASMQTGWECQRINSPMVSSQPMQLEVAS